MLKIRHATDRATPTAIRKNTYARTGIFGVLITVTIGGIPVTSDSASEEITSNQSELVFFCFCFFQ